MKPNNYRDEYIRIMSEIDVEDAVKQQIIKNCARRSTLNKIRCGIYKITAVIKDSIV